MSRSYKHLSFTVRIDDEADWAFFEQQTNIDPLFTKLDAGRDGKRVMAALTALVKSYNEGRKKRLLLLDKGDDSSVTQDSSNETTTPTYT